MVKEEKLKTGIEKFILHWSSATGRDIKALAEADGMKASRCARWRNDSEPAGCGGMPMESNRLHGAGGCP
ncbi:MAG: hypothetical protein HQL83_00755 [Magnetococcales bacterium]|nr:hypothetical protein [Magnetococcales bacterium]MBF0631203.1 hypothetical protein [Magnetococcales bacterium]